MLAKRLYRVSLFILLTAWLAACSTRSAVEQPAPRAVAEDPVLAAKLSLKGQKAYEAGRKVAALKAWEQAVTLNPKDAATINNLALLYAEDKQFSKAVDLLKTGLEHSPDVAQLHFNLAVISELYLLDLGTALEHYKRYEELAEAEDSRVAGWIADLERRVD